MENSKLILAIEEEITFLKRVKLDQNFKIDEITSDREKKLDEIFKDLISVVDAFDKADKRIEEQYPEDEAAIKTRKRFSTSKKKLIEILKKNGVEEMIFSDRFSTLEDCQIVDTEPDSTKHPNTILSIEKPGYRRNGRLLRLAEVIVVKN